MREDLAKVGPTDNDIVSASAVRTRRVLLLAHSYPPRPAIGAQRPLGLARYLHEFGWQPTVLTAKLQAPPPPIAPVVQTGYLDITAPFASMASTASIGATSEVTEHDSARGSVRRWLGRIVRTWMYFPDPQIGWYVPAIRVSVRLVEREPFDALISTSEPVTAHLIAGALKRKYPSLIWLADLRDLWTQNHYYKYGRIRRFLEAWLEMKTLGLADCLITVSQPLADTLQGRYQDKDVRTITNGFEPSDFCPNARKPGSKFSIVYTGSLYHGKRDPTLLFQALRVLLEQQLLDRSALEIQFYGPESPWLVGMVDEFGLHDIVKLPQQVSRSEALRKQQEATVLLLVNWNHPAEVGTYTGKVFEYLGARRPIIAVGGPKGVLAQLLAQTNAGQHFSEGEMEALREHLLDLYTTWRSTGMVPYSGDARVISQFTWRNVARQFAKVLDEYTRSERICAG